jgi:hypothetical protein
MNTKVSMNENMNEQEFGQEFHWEWKEKRQDEDEIEVACDAANRNEKLLICMFPR